MKRASFSHGRRVPHLLACLLGLCALINLYAALNQKEPEVITWMEQWLPFAVSEGSRVSLTLAALVQLVLIRGIWRGKKEAWRLSCAALVVIPLLHLGRAFDWHYALKSLVLLGTLIACRRHFRARSDSPSLRWAVILGVSASALLWVSGLVALQRFSAEMSGNQTWAGHAQTVAELMVLQSTDTQVAETAHARVVFNSISISAMVVWIAVLAFALRPVFLRDVPKTSDDEGLRKLVDGHGVDPLSSFAFLDDKRCFYYGEGDGRVAVIYALWRNVAVTLADPIGPSGHLLEAVASFTAFCRRQDWKPVFYEVAAENVEVYRRLGFATFKIGEDARLDLSTFSLQGGKFQNLRTALNKARKSGQVFRWYQGEPVDHGLEAQLKVVSDAWLLEKHGTEMTFDLGSFSLEDIRSRGVSVSINAEGRVEAFATWRPYLGGSGRCLDLMRTWPGARGVMDSLILETLEKFREDGVVEVSLGNAPLANVETESVVLQAEDRAVKYLFENFNHIYGYKSLFEFKKKYNPDWRGRYVAYDGLGDLPLVALALVRIHAPEGLWRILRS